MLSLTTLNQFLSVSVSVSVCFLAHHFHAALVVLPPLPRAFLLPAREEEDTVKVASRLELPLHSSPPLIGLDSSFEPTAEQFPSLKSSSLELFSI